MLKKKVPEAVVTKDGFYIKFWLKDNHRIQGIEVADSPTEAAAKALLWILKEGERC